MNVISLPAQSIIVVASVVGIGSALYIFPPLFKELQQTQEKRVAAGGVPAQQPRAANNNNPPLQPPKPNPP